MAAHLQSVGERVAGYDAALLAEWRDRAAKFCIGCLQGKMVEHIRVRSTKPLHATVPGQVGVADLMFIEIRPGQPKVPFYVHVDVFSHCLITSPMKGKTLDDVAHALAVIRGILLSMKRPLLRLVFDRESALVALELEIAASGLQLDLKAAGQKVGLAEVSIRFIREGARATKAGVRAMFGYMPPTQWNQDLCMDVVYTTSPSLPTSCSPVRRQTGYAISAETGARSSS
jgi:hypothetical protein